MITDDRWRDTYDAWKLENPYEITAEQERDVIEKHLRERIEHLLGLLDETAGMLKHSRCIDDDATRCPACSLESRIEEALKVRV